MSKLPVVIEFFYDVISPYSFLAFEVLCRYKFIWNIDLKLKPFYLPGIMKLSGNSAPAMVPNKGVYMVKDLNRLKQHFQVPITLPSDLMDILFKKGSLKPQRFLTAVDMLQPEYTEKLSRALWMRLYCTHEDIHEVESFKEAAKQIGMNEKIIQNAIELMNDEKAKNRLQLYTKQAMDYESFGAPVIVAHVNAKPEAFFGSDRFELLAFTLGEKWMGPVPQAAKL